MLQTRVLELLYFARYKSMATCVLMSNELVLTTLTGDIIPIDENGRCVTANEIKAT